MYPAVNAAMTAAINDSAGMVPDGSSKNVQTAAIIIAGMPMINENSAASLDLIPKRSAVPIVLPDIEMPGAIAIPCAIPMTRALFGASSPSGTLTDETMNKKDPRDDDEGGLQ